VGYGAIGGNGGVASSSNNTGIGFQSLWTASTGAQNTALGSQSLFSNTTAANNTAVGYQAGYNNTTGSNNVAVGFYTGGVGSNNTSVGYNSGRNNTGSNNVFLGYNAGNFTATFDNRLYIDNSTTTDPLIGGDFSSNRVGINKSPATVSTTLHVGGDLTVDTRTGTMATYAGFDSNGKLVSFTPAGGGGGPDSTIVVGGWGIDVAESPANTFTVKADTAEVATQYDLTLKQDKLVSGTNIKTVNSNSLVGSGNVSVGTVTSIATSAPISGGTITTTGTIGLNYDGGTLTLSGSNLAARNGSAIWNADQLQNTTIQSALNPSIGEVLTYTASNQWEASPAPAGTTNLTLTGSSSPFTLNSDTGTDVTFAAGTGIALSRSSNQLTVSSTLTAPETWGDFTTNIQSWGSTGTFGSGKDVGIGGQPSRDFDVIGDTRLRGAIYNSSNSAGSSGQVLTSQGTGAWIWATPADGSATNEAQTLSSSGGAISLSAVSGTGGGTVTLGVLNDLSLITSSNSITISSNTLGFGQLHRTSQLAGVSLSGNVKMDFNGSYGGAGMISVSSGTDDITFTNSSNRGIQITYSGSYKLNSDGEIKFMIYKNGSSVGYTGECVVENDYTENTLFSKTVFLQASNNDYFELYYTKNSGGATTIDLNNVVFNIRLLD
jgi:hypothetical protein